MRTSIKEALVGVGFLTVVLVTPLLARSWSPPEWGELFALFTFVASAVLSLILYLLRGSIRKLPMVVVVVVAVLLAAGSYWLWNRFHKVYGECVVTSTDPFFREWGPVFFPIDLDGPIIKWVDAAGSRQKAVNEYGPQAVANQLDSIRDLAARRQEAAMIMFGWQIGALAAATAAILVLCIPIATGTGGPTVVPRPPDPKRTDEEVYDVFLAHNTKDKEAVLAIARRLQEQNLTVWVDSWVLIPGQSVQKAMEQGIVTAKATVVSFGSSGLGPWQNLEMRGALIKYVEHNFPLIPVFLPGAPEKVEMPLFLRDLKAVDMRQGVDVESLRLLVCGIRGESPGDAAQGVPENIG